MSKITKVSDKLLIFLEDFESFESKPYLCPGNVATIGFGTTFYFDTKRFVKLTDKPISIDEARRLKKGHLENIFCPLVDKLCRDTLTQNEFDAIVSFVYNAGATYKDSKGKIQYYNLFRNVNALMFHDQLYQYWIKLAVKGGGKKLNGLVRRRQREVLMYTKNQY
jgi:lysozyme